MTLLYADGFEDGIGGLIPNNGTFSIGTGRFGNGAVLGSSNMSMSYGLGVPLSTAIIGLAVKSVGPGAIVGLMNTSSNFCHIGIERNVGGGVQAWSGNQAPRGTASAGNVLPINAWSFVEVKFTIHDTTGVVIVRVNGVEVLNLTGLDTKDSSQTTTSRVDFGSVLGGVTGMTQGGTAYDDLYICDTTGSVNNDFIGEIMVEHLHPGADDTVQWVGSDGNSVDNYALVDEVGAYNSADYVATSTVGQRDLYIPVASSRAISSPVAGVMINAVAQKTDAGTRTVKLCAKEGSGGTLRQSAALGLPTSFGEMQYILDRKADGSAFTVADVNNLRFGIEVTS